MTLSLDTVLAHSPDVAARLVGGRVVIAPLNAQPGDPLDDLFTLNETGRAIWGLVDGGRPLRAIVEILSERFEVAPAAIEGDVLLFVADLLDKRMLHVASADAGDCGPGMEIRSKAV